VCVCTHSYPALCEEDMLCVKTTRFVCEDETHAVCVKTLSGGAAQLTQRGQDVRRYSLNWFSLVNYNCVARYSLIGLV
jgi:hypothetical protein